MTETIEAIEDAPEMEAVESSDTPEVELEGDEQETETAQENSEEGNNEEEVEFPKKAVNALNRKNKQINKLRAQMRELEEKLTQVSKVQETPEINPDDFETLWEYNQAVIDAKVNEVLSKTSKDNETSQLTQQQQALQVQRDMYIEEQAKEATKALPDLPQVVQQHAAIFDHMPKEIEDIFYSIDNAPAAFYALAKNGKLEDLIHANPAVAAYEIMNAQNEGLAMMSKPQKSVSQAPTPISKARGTGSVKKQITPNDDVLKSLGLKK